MRRVGDGGRARRRPAGRRRTALLVGGTLVAVLVLALAAVAAVRMTHADRALPGTRVAGLDVAGDSAAEIRDQLAPVVADAPPVMLVGGGVRVPVDRADAGYAVDLDATARRAVQAGRDGFPFGAVSTLRGLVAPRSVAVAATVDDAAVGRVVRRLARQLDRPSFPGAIAVDPATLAVDTQPSRAGRRLDRRALRDTLRQALLERSTAPVAAPLRERRAVPGAEIEAVARAAARAVEAPLRLSGGGVELTVPPRELAPVLALEPVDGHRRARLGADPDRLAELVAWVAERADRPARDAGLSAPARPVVIDAKGDLTWSPRPASVGVTAARPGREVDQEALGGAVRRAIARGDRAVDLPVRRLDPAVSTASARRVRSIIGTFTTAYAPGEPRVTNIQRIAVAVDGTVIAPGAQFSLNGIAGERTRAKGYVPAPFIADGRIVPSVGGGVSQFSTTAYNAAFFAGLPLDVHRAHSLYIDRYPAGRESTLNYPDIDLRWTNDTDAPVLVRTLADATSVSVTLYGDNGGRRVRSESGPREPVEGGDFAITVTRVIRHPDGRTERQPVTTRYELPAEPEP